MGRTRGAKKGNDTKLDVASGSTSPPPTEYTASDLLDKAESILTESGEAELAGRFAQRAMELATATPEAEQEVMRANEVLAMCALEIGEEAEAKRVSGTVAANLSSSGHLEAGRRLAGTRLACLHRCFERRRVAPEQQQCVQGPC